MALPHEDWLPQAKRLYVGGRKRIYHGFEKRPNLIIENQPDRYVAYCQRCKEGGVVHKTHVPIKVPEPQKRYMPWPKDAKPLADCAMREQLAVVQLILRRGVDLTTVCPGVPLMYSKEQHRVLFGTAQGWLGRASAGQQPKWCNYHNELAYAVHPSRSLADGYSTVVLTEDWLSALKVQWALGDQALAIACLGTELRKPLVSALVSFPPELVVGMWDGDAAGDSAAQRALRRLPGLGLTYTTAEIPRGLDPKDLDRDEIREVYHRTTNSPGAKGAP